MTIGAIDAINRAGLSFPEDIGLVGFDEMSWALSLRSAITSVVQPTYDIGRAATELLLRRVRGEEFPVKHVVLPAELHVRSSSRRATGPGSAARRAAG
jgi:LacI family transcriptional regulator